MNRTSVQLADGSGDYAAALGIFSELARWLHFLTLLDVYHHLHCIVGSTTNFLQEQATKR